MTFAAKETAGLGQTEMLMGIVPGGGGTPLPPQLMTRALEHGVQTLEGERGPGVGHADRRTRVDLDGRFRHTVGYRRQVHQILDGAGPVDRIVEVALTDNRELDLAVAVPGATIATYAAQPVDRRRRCSA